MVTLSALIAVAAMLAAVGYNLLVLKAARDGSKGTPRTPVTGPDALIGLEAEVIEAFTRSRPGRAPLGQVRARGELWKAELPADTARLAAVGDHVYVVGVTGLLLKVVCR